MFAGAELGRRLDPKAYKAALPKLREDLLDAQFRLRDRGEFPCLVLLSGFDAAGKGEAANALTSWMDPRLIAAHAFPPPTEDERQRPPMWRFWRDLPPNGTLGLFFGAWYADLFHDWSKGAIDEAGARSRLGEIEHFERMLADEGALIVKFWLHLSKKAQKTRLKSLENDPATAWRVTKVDWRHHRRYDDFRAKAEFVLRRSGHAEAPWIVIESGDHHYRDVSVARHLSDLVQARLDRTRTPAPSPPRPIAPIDGVRLLDRVDLTHRLDKAEYKQRLAAAQARIAHTARKLRTARRAGVLVFEGVDAAGKGGTIRRIGMPIDPRHMRIHAIAAPSDEERARPYLWRFWRRVPRHGEIAIFDRSWYGRVLVERVEGFAADADWLRAYDEINDFEAELARNGVFVLKFWLTISAEEQLRRFEDRAQTAHKRHKLTDEDWRNRGKWRDYVEAASDMFARTSTPEAPWVIVEAEDKRYGRVKAAETVAERLSAVVS